MEKVIQLLEFEKSTLNDLIKYEVADESDYQMIAEIDQALKLLQSRAVGRSEQLLCPETQKPCEKKDTYYCNRLCERI